MTAFGVGPITAMAVVSAFGDAARFRRSSSAGAYLGLTPRRYESGEISRNDGSRSAEIVLPGNASMKQRMRSSAGISAAPACAAEPSRSQSEPAPGKPRSRWRESWRSHCMPCSAPTPPSGRSQWHSPTHETTLIHSAPERVQPGRAARKRPPPRSRPRSPTPSRSFQF